MHFEKTRRAFFHKTFKNLTKLLFRRYLKPSKPSSTRSPFSCGSCRENVIKVANRSDYVTGNVRVEFSEEIYKEEKVVEGKVSGFQEGKKKHGSGRSGKTMSVGEFELARMMKELKMMGAGGGDVEQALDVEEALRYYSRLKSPVYMDRFFMDMYGDFSTPQQHPYAPSKSGTCSRQMLGLIRF